jgi:hypothetical protein
MSRPTHLLVLLCLSVLVLPVAGAQRGPRGIVVYEHAGFRGESRAFTGQVRSLRQAGMNDQISSLRIGRGESWELCEDDDFRGRCEVFSGETVDLASTGLNDRVSSLRRAGSDDSGGWGGGGRLELFEDRRFDGKSVAIEEPARSLGSMDAKAESLRLSGRWEICDSPNFRGRCITVSRDVPDLDDIGWKERIRSARPR